MKMPNITSLISKKSKTLLVFTLILAISGVLGLTLFNKPQQAQAAWYTNGGTWNYRQKITIDHTKVTNTDQTDFPVLIKITDTNNPIFTKAKDDGTDLLFAASDETTKLSYEIESFSKSTHELDAWVKISSLSHSADTIIYLYYGNASATGPSAAEKQAVWSNGYIMTQHMNDNTTSSIADSTANAIVGTKKAVNEPIEASGKIGKGLNFDGADDYVETSASTVFDIGNVVTMGGWMYRDTNTNDYESIVNHMKKTSSYDGYWLGSMSDGKIMAFIGPYTNQVKTTNAVSSGGWHQVNLVSNGTTFAIYVDGLKASGDQPVVAITTTNVSVRIGRSNAASEYFDGLIDEVHISTAVRTPDWISTEYANQNTPSSFFSLEAEAGRDQTAPSNPTSFTAKDQSGGSTTLTSGNYYNYPTPYISWPAAEQAGGAHDTGEIAASGVAGYYSYFGTSCGDGGGNPTQSSGVLNTSGLSYSTSPSITVPNLGTAEATYCLRIKTKDNTGNISDVSEVFTYKYDVTAPNPPTFVAVNPAGYSSTDSFEFSWPVASDVDGATASGLAGYQYERGANSGDNWSSTIIDPKISNIKSYQTGENIFLVRSIDNAGNASTAVQTTYYFSANPPTKPTSATVDPEISDINSFSFSWAAPVHPRPIVDYGYVVNAVPTVSNLTWTHSSATTLAADHFATKQGPNTLYLVAKDDSGAYATDEANYASFEFNCTTPAPPIPTTLSVTDSSDRLLERYMLTLQWQAGVGQDAGNFGHYLIERSTDGVTFSEIATPTSTAYIDSDLSTMTTYYYRIKAVDNAGSVSAASTVVSKIPTGKYTTPPTIVSEPTVSVKATIANISWVVNRVSTASVRFGTSKDDLSDNKVSAKEGTDHTIEITGLLANTTYYYQVQSLDPVDKEYSLESAYSAVYHFTTPAAPSIANVTISNITLKSADISWETSSASNTKVHYGSSVNYGTILPESDNSMTTLHSVKLQNLAHTTRYHFKIYGDDIDGNILSSDDYIFDTLPMPTISLIESQSDFSGPAPTVNITWLTNVPTTSSVEYTPIASADSVVFEESQSALVSNHSVTMSNMLNDTEYKFTVSGVDKFGNKTVSDLQVLKTNSDSRPPTISNVVIESSNVGSGNTNEARIIISWQSDELSTSQVAYDEGLSGNDYRMKTPPDTALIKNHIVIVSGLKPGTPYHFKIISADENGNLAKTQDQTVITGQVTESVFNILSRTFNNLFGWLGKF